MTRNFKTWNPGNFSTGNLFSLEFSTPLSKIICWWIIIIYQLLLEFFCILLESINGNSFSLLHIIFHLMNTFIVFPEVLKRFMVLSIILKQNSIMITSISFMETESSGRNIFSFHTWYSLSFFIHMYSLFQWYSSIFIYL